MTAACHLCGSGRIQIFPPPSMHSVTSDCRPWAGSFPIAVCSDCGGITKHPSPAWQETADQIYQSYQLYQNTGGREQAAFSKSGTHLGTRSDQIADHLRALDCVAEKGRLLDVGSGTGSFIHAFRTKWPEWSFYAQDPNADGTALKSSPNETEDLSGFYQCELSEIPQKFDLISLIHVLEHIVSPLEMLRQIGSLLAPNGKLLIQVPDLQANPFDLMVADHVSHFLTSRLMKLVEESGLHVHSCSRDIVAKEITLIAAVQPASVPVVITADKPEPLNILKHSLAWLQTLVIQTQTLSIKEPIGLFGTAIAANWLYGCWPDRIDFFVDENPYLLDRKLHGLPIYRPDDIPAGSRIFLPLPTEIASHIAQRLARPGLEFHSPPAMVTAPGDG